MISFKHRSMGACSERVSERESCYHPAVLKSRTKIFLSHRRRLNQGRCREDDRLTGRSARQERARDKRRDSDEKISEVQQSLALAFWFRFRRFWRFEANGWNSNTWNFECQTICLNCLVRENPYHTYVYVLVLYIFRQSVCVSINSCISSGTWSVRAERPFFGSSHRPAPEGA